LKGNNSTQTLIYVRYADKHFEQNYTKEFGK